MFAMYVRVSEVGEREGESFGSPAEQEAAAREWAERSGADIYFDAAECTDLDVSGEKDASERKLGGLIDRCESGEFEGIIFYDLDRFSRDRLSGGAALLRIKECGAKAVFVRQGLVYPAESNLVVGILLEVAQDQRERLRLARIKGRQRAAERGLHLAARVPTGYRWADRQKGGRGQTEGGGIGRLEPDPKMAAKVTDAFERRANGESFEKIARRLGLAGKSSARAVITNRVYLGEATVPTERKGETRVIPNAHPALVTGELWERANAIGTGSYIARSGRWSAMAQLVGIARCAGCGKPLSVGSMGGRTPYYACTAEGCTQRTGIRADRLERYVDDVLSRAVVDEVPEVIAILEGDDRYQRALDAVEGARVELDTYRAEIKVSDVGAEQWKRDVAARKAKLDIVRKELRSITPTREAYSSPLRISDAEWATMKPPKPEGMTDDEWNALTPEQRDEHREKSERYQIVASAMERDRFARMIDRVLVKPCGRGKRVPVEQRADVYFIGAELPAAA